MLKWSYRNSICLGLNLCHAFALGHQVPGYVIGDPNSENFMFDRFCQVTIADMDSGQIQTDTTVFHCRMTTLNYSAPEILTSNSMLRSVHQDYFALAVMLFELLSDGHHPFAGRVRRKGKPPGIAARIEGNYFPYKRSWCPAIWAPRIERPPGDVFDALPRTLQRLFIGTFCAGHRDPMRRGTPEHYTEALHELEQTLTRCSANALHEFHMRAPQCPWCMRAARLGVDSFEPPVPSI